jgi:hypothetical protein
VITGREMKRVCGREVLILSKYDGVSAARTFGEADDGLDIKKADVTGNATIWIEHK